MHKLLMLFQNTYHETAILCEIVLAQKTFGYVPTYTDVTLTQQDGIKVVKLKLGQILPGINY